jgi:probable pyridine nucleotide-disulfide oxidoreductase
MEMAQAFRRLGSEVVVLEAGPQLAAREDSDVAFAIQALFEEDGIELALNARDAVVTGRSGDHVTVRLGDDLQYSGTHLLVAAGRRPMTEGIGLAIAGVTLDAKGFIVVNETLRATAPGVWVIGEVAGTPMFTHASLDDYRVARSGITGGNRTTVGRLIPCCVFIDPNSPGSAWANAKHARPAFVTD